MAKKAFAAVVLAILAIFAVPAAANAAGYTPSAPSATTTVGGSTTLTFTGFPANVPSTATAPDAVTLAVFKATTLSKPTNADGAVSYTASATAPGTYTITVTAGGVTAVGTLTVAPADAGSGSGGGGGLPSTGYDAPVLIIWAAGGALALGIALVVVLGIVRRQRAQA
ncbi:hypothetical protein [Compostimonas suwonensis]|uniref:LPXTG-motif cell wall-anchored protein n=1 Tax=Compostimonas suwonensis TaxID=1048394 RepID=A0A2M9BC73_9MICO|nr:hypothetical protein [Compostimonas suwonensis]PJJ55548.1 hypothetical protein CLV54_2895 [Compostimonas suwonensis]